jgi:type I restriction enzyme S subunit
VPFLKVYHITDSGEIDFHYRPSFVSKTIHAGLLKRSVVYPDDVLMNIVGPPLGKIGIVPSEYPEWNINQAIAIFRAKERIDPVYLLHALRHKPILSKLLSQAVGVRQYNLSLEQCRNFMIPLPPLALQYEFAQRVREAREIQSRQAQSAERVEALYQSMLSRSFAGEL